MTVLFRLFFFFGGGGSRGLGRQVEFPTDLASYLCGKDGKLSSLLHDLRVVYTCGLFLCMFEGRL